METFTPFASTFGGALLGLSASTLLFFSGRIAGVSGIVAGAARSGDDGGWRRSFLVGMLLVGALAAWANPAAFESTVDTGVIGALVAGLLVGFGTRLGSGCTSGHGVCGLPRFSKRSLAAVVTFIGTGVVTVTAMRLADGV